MVVVTRKQRRMMEEATAEPLNTVLPKELMIEILSRVESSDALQLRCVCKSWNSLVLDPQFAQNYIKKLCSEIIVHLQSDIFKHFKWTIRHFQSGMNAAALWDNLDEEYRLHEVLVFVRCFKKEFKTADMQILEDRVKCLKSFFKIYHKSATSSSSQL